MNLMQYPRSDYSISHFARPQSWELDGRDFDLVMDDGWDVRLRFAGRKVAFAREGQGESGALSCAGRKTTSMCWIWPSGW